MSGGYAELPREVLEGVFRHLLCGPPGGQEGVPLARLAATWFALRLTCKWWAACLTSAPLEADVAAARPAALRWLAAGRHGPVPLLRLGRLGAARSRRRRAASEPAQLGQLAEPREVLEALGLGAREAGGREELGPADLLETMGFTMAGLGPHALVSIFSFSQLQVLHVRGALSRTGEHCAFNSMPLSGLHNLTHLRLERFTHFRLGCLPASLRTLRLSYQEPPLFSSETHPLLDVLDLPPEIRLDRLELDSRGSLGFLACELLAQCRTAVVRATRVYMGVCMLPEALGGGLDDEAFFKAHSTPEGLRCKAAVMAAAAQQLAAALAGAAGPQLAQGQQQRGAAPGGSWGGMRQAAGGGYEGLRCRHSADAAPGRLLELLEFQWMCAEALVVVPLLLATNMDDFAWHVEAEVTLGIAQAIVHSGEEPTVEVTPAALGGLAGQETERGRGTHAVRVEHSAGNEAAMLLRFSCVPRSGGGSGR